VVIGLYFFDYRKLEKHSLKIYGGTMLLLAGTMLFGLSANGQKIYLALGPLPLTINTFSVSPIFFSIALAGIFKNFDWSQPKKICQGLIFVLLPFLFLLNGSLVAAVIYAVTCITLMMASGARPKILLLLTGMISAVMAWLIISAPIGWKGFSHSLIPAGTPREVVTYKTSLII
jgi:cell division protein FtsW (lipid II flippase)